MDRSMIDAASGGAVMDKTPAVARHLISNMARPSQSRMVNEIGVTSNLMLENQLSELTSLVRQLVVGQHQPSMATKVCGICTFVEHPTDLCPTLQEIESDQPKSVGEIGGYQYGKQPNHFSQGRVKGHMQLRDSDRHRMCLKDQHAMNNQLRNIKHHRSNSSSSRECHCKAILHIWRT
ncbi:hypothetical protein CR513_05538, partial [Mucuna pruriens]